jgi:hypothetical protein
MKSRLGSREAYDRSRFGYVNIKEQDQNQGEAINTGNEAIELSWFITQQFGKSYAIVWQFLT